MKNENRKIKIGILTLPLHNNYGGILQAYALMTILKKMGHDVWLIDLRHNSKIPKWKLPLVYLKRATQKYILKEGITIFHEKEQQRQNKEIQEFINISVQPKTRTFYLGEDLKKIEEYEFEAYIVGSDQVWRQKYNKKYIKNYFFDFVNSDKTRKLSYAASFGVDTWQYDRKITEEISTLAKSFTAISVREDSGVKLCEKHLKVQAFVNLDPTMLLDSLDYIKLLDKDDLLNSSGDILTYILDSSLEKNTLISDVSKILKYSVFSIGHKYKADNTNESLVNPSIINWLHGFKNAKFVITDSFHGCVFSIIFNKPFIVIGNEERGLARFNSLLKLFKLESRLVLNNNNLDTIISDPIDWILVNEILNIQRKKAFSYFNNYLNN